jgi:hypothetical protein
LKLRDFSREAAAADSRGRQPTDSRQKKTFEPRSGDSNPRHQLLSPLRGLWILNGMLSAG